MEMDLASETPFRFANESLSHRFLVDKHLFHQAKLDPPLQHPE